MILKVKKYIELENYHLCVNEEGKDCKVDILTDGKFPGKNAYDLEGKIIECEYTYPYLEMAMGAKLK